MLNPSLTPMTPEHIEELESLIEKASPGPWTASGEKWFDYGVRDKDGVLVDSAYREPEEVEANDRFVCAARSALPALCQEWRRLKAENEQLKAQLRLSIPS